MFTNKYAIKTFKKYAPIQAIDSRPFQVKTPERQMANAEQETRRIYEHRHHKYKTFYQIC